MHPSQVGKTTACRSLSDQYLNWDNADDRRRLLRGPAALAETLQLDRLQVKPPVAVLDELHKYSKWNSLLKGFFDTYGDRVHLIVTGSSRPDLFRRGSDSLMGRYLLYRMHPWSVGESQRTDLPTRRLDTQACGGSCGSDMPLALRGLVHGGTVPCQEQGPDTCAEHMCRSYADAGYFKRNLRAIEVLVDQEVVRSGRVANEPWKFYDLGHGYCTYDFFDQCPHRMACAKCSFYSPKRSSQAQLLEGKTNLVQLRQDIPLSDEEVAAVDEGIAAMESLLGKLVDVSTPAGSTPREIGAARQEPTVEGGELSRPV